VLIATWNVNSIRTRLEQIKEFLNEVKPDLLCLQETKVDDPVFPEKEFHKEGFKVFFHGQKSYNGVALISRHQVEDVRFGFMGELPNDKEAIRLSQQKRIISGLIRGIRVVNVYVPNGSAITSEKYIYKVEWLNYLYKYLAAQKERNEPLCLLGDFNIAPDKRDLHDPGRLTGGIMASKKERELLSKVLDERLEDVFRVFEADTNYWTWWDYRSSAWERDKGWRIDHIYLSEELIRNSKSCIIHKKTRGNIQPSDHAPVLVDLEWSEEEELEEDNDDFF
tara:strand:+ start:1074 stop:1910 length:837 start_codon:yes stop_codon:yes gene_type:complete